MRKKFLASLLSLCLLIGLLPTAALPADAETPTADTSWYNTEDIEFTLTAEEWAALSGTVGKASINGVIVNPTKTGLTIELNDVLFETGVEVKLYKDAELLTTATLAKLEAGYYGELTCNLLTSGADEYWPLTSWVAQDNKVPNKVVLLVDGKETDTKEFTLTAEEWAALSGTQAPNSGSSSGGGSGSTTYAITVDSSKNGDVTISSKSASKGRTVTITVKPDDGYELDELTVTDKNGDTVKMKKVSDTKYTFTMPASKVTVEADFVKVVDASEDLPFADVAEDAYYYDAVAWALDEGITGGTSATTFSPNASCTRAQTVTFLWRAAGSPAPKSSVNPFTDVSADAYYYNAVLWAVEQGITVGTSATTFSPDATVTRAQNVTFLWRWAKSPATKQVNNFTDVAADAYYYGAVAWAAEEGITGGTSATTFSPNADCTRAQIVTFLYRYLAD